MEKKDIIYCAFCGSKNDIKDKKCKKCNKKLNPKNHLFKDYLKDHIKDDLKGNVEDGILEIIENWIRSHLFGIGFTALIGILGVAVILNEVNLKNISNKKSYKEVDKPFTLKVFCEEKELVDKIKVCDEGYNLEDDKCVKRYSVNANKSTICPSNFYQSGDTCLSNYTTDKQEDITCNDIAAYMVGSDGFRYKTFGTIIQSKTCYARLCHDMAGVASPSSIDDCASVELVEVGKTSKYYCNNYTDSNGNCHDTKGFVNKYSCSNGSLNGTKCDITETKEYNEVCPDGTSFDEECGKCLKGGE